MDKRVRFVFNWCLKNKVDLSKFRWTVDEPEDLDVIRSIMFEFGYDRNIRWENILDLYKTKPEIFKVNSMFKRNEGSNISKGQKLWKRAKKVIPGKYALIKEARNVLARKMAIIFF